MKRTTTVTLELGEFTLDALAGGGPPGPAGSSVRIDHALRYYLDDGDSDRPGWPCPSFLPGDSRSDRVEVELKLDEALWRSLEREASRQGVPAQRLAEHAVLYFAADRDAGRITQRILDDLED